MARKLSLDQQEKYLEDDKNIFKIPQKKSPITKSASNDISKVVASYVPIINNTQEWQDEEAFLLLWNFCHGISVSDDHPLRTYKEKTLQSRSGWKRIAEDCGLWAASVIHVYLAFASAGASGAKALIEWKCYVDPDLRILFFRYKSRAELESFFRWPSRPSICDPDEQTREEKEIQAELDSW